MSKTRTRLSYDYDRTTLTIRIDPRLLERLRAAGPSILGGYSRIVDDCIRLGLPLYEVRSEIENEKDLDQIRKFYTSVLRPDGLAECIVEACKEIMKLESKPQGRRKP